jgi:hypothetical protein
MLPAATLRKMKHEYILEDIKIAQVSLNNID